MDTYYYILVWIDTYYYVARTMYILLCTSIVSKKEYRRSANKSMREPLFLNLTEVENEYL